MTLTLAGIAAFILSVGMAVDANILIFERTKEELRSGQALGPAIEAGFSRAWNSILDSNVSTLITAFILFYFGTSVVKGFALVLIIGVLISMFTAITLSRLMLRWIVRQPWARSRALFGISDEEVGLGTPATRGRGRPSVFDIIGKRRYVYVFSVVVTVGQPRLHPAHARPRRRTSGSGSRSPTPAARSGRSTSRARPRRRPRSAHVLEEHGLPGSEVAITGADGRDYVLIRTEALTLIDPQAAPAASAEPARAAPSLPPAACRRPACSEPGCVGRCGGVHRACVPGGHGCRRRRLRGDQRARTPRRRPLAHPAQSQTPAATAAAASPQASPAAEPSARQAPVRR